MFYLSSLSPAANYSAVPMVTQRMLVVQTRRFFYFWRAKAAKARLGGLFLAANPTFRRCWGLRVRCKVNRVHCSLRKVNNQLRCARQLHSFPNLVIPPNPPSHHVISSTVPPQRLSCLYPRLSPIHCLPILISELSLFDNRQNVKPGRGHPRPPQPLQRWLSSPRTPRRGRSCPCWTRCSRVSQRLFTLTTKSFTHISVSIWNLPRTTPLSCAPQTGHTPSSKRTRQTHSSFSLPHPPPQHRLSKALRRYRRFMRLWSWSQSKQKTLVPRNHIQEAWVNGTRNLERIGERHQRTGLSVYH